VPREGAQQAVHEALAEYLDDGELALSWVLVIDVAGMDGERYLAHRAGGGADGTDSPISWAALGMLQAAARVAEQQVLEATLGEDEEEG
jgi:hypothetical protein